MTPERGDAQPYEHHVRAPGDERGDASVEDILHYLPVFGHDIAVKFCKGHVVVFGFTIIYMWLRKTHRAQTIK